MTRVPCFLVMESKATKLCRGFPIDKIACATSALSWWMSVPTYGKLLLKTKAIESGQEMAFKKAFFVGAGS